MSADNLDQLLKFDPLAEAERTTGNSYKDDPGTSLLGLALALAHGDRKREALQTGDDTHYGTSFADTLRIYAELGFSVIADRPFQDDEHTERLVTLWRDGILATVESYRSSANSSKIYYNWQPNEGVRRQSYTSSGHGHGDPLVWVGDHDAREGLRHTLGRLESAGKLLPVWIERPFLWLLSYTDSKTPDYSYEEINATAIEAFPASVRTAITPEAAA